MIRARCAKAVGLVLPMLLPAFAGAQHRGGATAASSGSVSVPYPSTIPPIRMGSLPQGNGISRPWVDGRRWDRAGHSFGSGFGNRPLHLLGRARGGFVDIMYLSQRAVAYQVPVYVPVPVPVYVPQYVPAPEKPALPYDPEKSKMLTIGAGADGGAGVMRIEQVSDSVLRLTWLGSNRRIREARLFVADSAQRPLRTSLIDAATPSALFLIGPFASKVAYTGLTVIFADGATQTTLVPYPPTSVVKP